MTTPFVRTFGDGPVPVFALHCSLAHSGSWGGVAMACDPYVTMRAMDLPGHGKSPQPTRPEEAGELAVSWAAEAIETPMHLCGHSFGAYVALRLAVERPEKVLSLSLYEPVFFAAAREFDPEVYAARFSEMAELDGLMVAQDYEGAAKRFVQDWGGGLPWEMLPEEMRKMMAAGMPLVVGANEALIEDSADILSRVSEISVPTLLMDGAESHPIVKPIQDSLADKINGAKRQTLKGVGHMGVISHPKDVAAAYLAHIGMGA